MTPKTRSFYSMASASTDSIQESLQQNDRASRRYSDSPSLDDLEEVFQRISTYPPILPPLLIPPIREDFYSFNPSPSPSTSILSVINAYACDYDDSDHDWKRSSTVSNSHETSLSESDKSAGAAGAGAGAVCEPSGDQGAKFGAMSRNGLSRQRSCYSSPPSASDGDHTAGASSSTATTSSSSNFSHPPASSIQNTHPSLHLLSSDTDFAPLSPDATRPGSKVSPSLSHANSPPQQQENLSSQQQCTLKFTPEIDIHPPKYNDTEQTRQNQHQTRNSERVRDNSVRLSRSLSYLRSHPLKRRLSKKSAPFGGTKTNVHTSSNSYDSETSDTRMQPKNNKRPGFFRRLFGASKDSHVSTSQNSNSVEWAASYTESPGTTNTNPPAVKETRSKPKLSPVNVSPLQKDTENMQLPLKQSPELEVGPRTDSLKPKPKPKPENIHISNKPVPQLNLEPNSPFSPEFSSKHVGLGLGLESNVQNQVIYDDPKGEAEASEEDHGPPLPHMETSNEPVYTAPYSPKPAQFSPLIKESSTSPLVKTGTVDENGPKNETMSPETTGKNSEALVGGDDESPSTTVNGSFADDETTAKRLYDGVYELPHDEYAQWLGSDGERQKGVRPAYMDLFDLSGKSILAALRLLCDRLYMKGESQQLNRVIEAFSQSWVDKNPQHGFYDSNVVYTIAYALILLNTDIHGADHTVQKRMAKSAFVHNTLETVRTQSRAERQTEMAVEELNGKISLDDLRQSTASPLSFKRSSYSLPGSTQSITPYDTTVLVGESPVKPLTREWEFHVESILKVFYTSIHKQALKLHLVENSSPQVGTSIYNGSHLTPSLSAAPSIRSAAMSTNSTSLLSKVGSRFRSSAGNNKNYENQSRLSVIDRSTESFRRDSLTSNFSFESNYSSVGRPAVGFAGLLWNSMIKEEDRGSVNANDFGDFEKIEAELAKEVELELHGAPWAKEGLLKYRPYIDPNTGKKPKKKDWLDVFVVVQRGQLKIFNMRPKNNKKSSNVNNGVVGAGNWMDNAQLVDGFHLCHTMAQELPPPKKSSGFSALWSLALPQRGLLVFQAGTTEIAQEYVYTCNYWAGRLSKEPFEEPVSSMEFGWGVVADPQMTRTTSMSTLRSNYRNAGSRPGDHINIREWRPSGHSMVVSDLNEDTQLSNLKTYVGNAEDKLTEHNALRTRMVQSFTPGSPNWNKAHNNWERKSQYLLQQLIRYKTYVEALERGLNDKLAKEAKPQEPVQHRPSYVDGEEHYTPPMNEHYSPPMDEHYTPRMDGRRPSQVTTYTVSSTDGSMLTAKASIVSYN